MFLGVLQSVQGLQYFSSELKLLHNVTSSQPQHHNKPVTPYGKYIEHK